MEKQILTLIIVSLILSLSLISATEIVEDEEELSFLEKIVKWFKNILEEIEKNSNKTKNNYSIPSPPKPTTVRLVPSEMEEYNPSGHYYKSCVWVETIGEAGGIKDSKQKTCREACGKRNLNYKTYSCDRDFFVCYCKD